MRACFLGQNVCALGYGVATLQTPRLEPPERPEDEPAEAPPYGFHEGNFSPRPTPPAVPPAA